ncbi:phosphoinositide 3-kinase regulatory subunit 5-like isoform X2 [Kryptolebias marmoratus]|uniref:Phosphoinositide 3-kinase regulatory subunit 5 n=2 Tax=Kryptolebias marmoratus TaxID=37003 RepID=A0A3Q3AKS2_KRYMA|nr:phosphoinositide 3-kinase regulatory subunit 5-like isoform X2 [Kryptolebias marmoratus]
MEQSSCTEDRIRHVLERCLCHLGLDSPDKHLWNAGLCVSRWCLEELVKRDPHNFLILLQKLLEKTKEVLEQCRYELVVPLTLLFSSALLGSPYIAPDCGVLQEADLLFHGFLTWPEPCSSACKQLLNIIQQERRAPGISFQRLIRTEQGICPELTCSKTVMVLLVSPDDENPLEVQSVSEQLSTTHDSTRDVIPTLILHSFQAAFGTKHDLQALHTSLEGKHPQELEQLMESITSSMEAAASVADPKKAREGLLRSLEKLGEGLTGRGPAGSCPDTGFVETFMLPLPKCHTRLWEDDNFDVLKNILGIDSDLDSPPDCFLQADIDEDDGNETTVDDEFELDLNRGDHEFQSHRISGTSTSSRDSTFSSNSMSSTVSVPCGSSGVESDFGEEVTQRDTEEGHDSQPESRKKPKKKSKSLLGLERFSLLFKTPRSPRACHHAESMGYNGDINRDFIRAGGKLKHPRFHVKQACPTALDPLSLVKQVCFRRRPILSVDEGTVADVPSVVKVVIFGGDREAGRLARAYSDLQQKESKCPQLTRMCKLQFYFVPTKRRIGSTGAGHSPAEGQVEGLTKTAANIESNSIEEEDFTTDIAHFLGLMDPWYDRNVVSLLSLSSDVLCEAPSKDEDVSTGSGGAERLSLLADLVLYYCRHADKPVLVQLYQAELTLAGGEKRREVFIHTLELGHTAGTRALKAMGAATKRFGIDKEREAVPLTLSVAYNKVAVSRRSQWIQTETVCTSINLRKTCRRAEELDLQETLQLTLTEVLKRQCPKLKKGYNQQILTSEVKVDRVQVTAQEAGTTFAVCLDQDQKTFIQSVTRCEVTLCSKPGTSSDWRSYRHLPGQVQPLHPTYRSLLCLPVTCFSTSYP